MSDYAGYIHEPTPSFYPFIFMRLITIAWSVVIQSLMYVWWVGYYKCVCMMLLNGDVFAMGTAGNWVTGRINACHRSIKMIKTTSVDNRNVYALSADCQKHINRMWLYCRTPKRVTKLKGLLPFLNNPVLVSVDTVPHVIIITSNNAHSYHNVNNIFLCWKIHNEKYQHWILSTDSMESIKLIKLSLCLFLPGK